MILKIKNVYKGFRHDNGMRPVLQNICLDVAQKEFLVIVGPSGCGKTTLLKIIAGLIPCCNGSLEYGEPHKPGPCRSRQLLFQDPAIFPWKTVLNNVAFGLTLMGYSKQEQQRIAHHYIDITGLKDFADYHPHQLSGGMKQMLQLARCLAVNPEMLLMDEPFASLDEISRSKMVSDLETIWMTEKKTVVFVTHSLEEAIVLADRIVLFDTGPGRIIFETEVKLKRPRDLFDPEVIALRHLLRDKLNREDIIRIPKSMKEEK